MSDRRLEVILAAKDVTGTAFAKVTARTKALSKQVFSLQGAMTGLAGAAGLGLVVKKSLDAADKMGKVADSVGITTDSLQKYRYAANLSGIETKVLDRAMQSFAKRTGEAAIGSGSLYSFLKKNNEALLKQVQSANSTSEALDLIFNSLGQTKSATEKAALAAAAFGRTGLEMTVMTKNGAAGLNAMLKEAEDLGIVLDNSLIRGAEDANDAIARVTEAVNTGFMTAMTSLAPGITSVADEISTWNKNNRELIDSGIKDFMAEAATAAGTLYDAIDPIVTTGFDAFKNIWGWYSGLPAGVQTMGILAYMLAGPAGAAAIIAIGAAVKDVSDDMLLAEAGLLDVDGALDLYTEHYNEWLKAHDLTTAATRDEIAAYIRSEKALKELAKTSQDMADICDDITTATDKQTKALKKTTTAIEDLAGTAAWGTQEWKDYADSVDWMQSEMDLFAASVGDVDVALEKQADTLKDTAKVSKETVEDMGIGWDDFSKSLEGVLAGTFSGEFDSIGGMFDDLLGSMYSMFVNWAAKVAAQQIIFNISSGEAGANTLGSMFSGGGSGGSAISNIGSLFSGAKTGYSTVTGGSLMSQFYTPATAAGPTTAGSAGGLTATSIMGIVAAAIAMETQASKMNPNDEVYIDGEKVDITNAFSGQFLHVPTIELLGGLMGGGPSGAAYMDASISSGNFPEFMKGMFAQWNDDVAASFMIGSPLPIPWAGALMGNPMASLFGFGDKPKDPSFYAHVSGVQRDSEGHLVGSGLTPGQGAGSDWIGKYVVGEADKNAMNATTRAFDGMIGDYIDSFDASLGLLSNTFGELSPAFDTAIEDAFSDFDFVMSWKGDADRVSLALETTMNELDKALGDAVAPTIVAFTTLQTAIGEITPAMNEFNNALGDATAHYFDPLLAIDQKILASSDDPFTQNFKHTMFEDSAAQVGTYKTLYDNAVTNDLGFDSIVKFGNLYSDAIANFQKMSEGEGFYLSGFASTPSQSVMDANNTDLTSVLKGIRDSMIEAGGTPDQFEANVKTSLEAFNVGINAGLQNLVDAITNLHPEIEIDVTAYKVVEQVQVSATTGVARNAA